MYWSKTLNITLCTGAAMRLAAFLLGSTVICCFAEGSVELAEHLTVGSKVKMGEDLGTFNGA